MRPGQQVVVSEAASVPSDSESRLNIDPRGASLVFFGGTGHALQNDKVVERHLISNGRDPVFSRLNTY